MDVAMLLKTIKKAPDLLLGVSNLINDRPIGFSFNVSDRCPVGCQCYWRAQERVPELSDEDVIRFFEEKKRQGYIHTTLVGGEPYVRRNLLPRLTEILPLTWIVTSGTTPLLDLKATHFISIDGPNAEIHDKVRRMSGLYVRILKHLADLRTKSTSKVYIHCVLNALNKDFIWEIVYTWAQNNLVDGIVFSTMTPIKDANDESLRLFHGDREKIVEDLLTIKASYTDFICMTDSMVHGLHPDCTVHRTPETCGTARFAKSFYADGKPIPQCILSDKADCSECGCVVTSFLDNVGFSKDCYERLALALSMSTY